MRLLALLGKKGMPSRARNILPPQRGDAVETEMQREGVKAYPNPELLPDPRHVSLFHF